MKCGKSGSCVTKQRNQKLLSGLVVPGIAWPALPASWPGLAASPLHFVKKTQPHLSPSRRHHQAAGTAAAQPVLQRTAVHHLSGRAVPHGGAGGTAVVLVHGLQCFVLLRMPHMAAALCSVMQCRFLPSSPHTSFCPPSTPQGFRSAREAQRAKSGSAPQVGGRGLSSCLAHVHMTALLLTAQPVFWQLRRLVARLYAATNTICTPKLAADAGRGTARAAHRPWRRRGPRRPRRRPAAAAAALWAAGKRQRRSGGHGCGQPPGGGAGGRSRGGWVAAFRPWQLTGCHASLMTLACVSSFECSRAGARCAASAASGWR